MDEQEPFSERQSRGRWIPYFVLLLSLSASGAAAVFVWMTAEEEDRARFSADVERTRIAISNRIDAYSASLRNITALFQTGGIPNKQQFHDYLARLEIQRYYPGIQGIGFSLRVPAADKDKTIKTAREYVDPAFHIWPEEPARAEYHTVFYLEPLNTRNQRAIGYDMHTDPIQAAAMDGARDQGGAMASGKVALVQEGNDPQKQAGCVIYMPVFKGKELPKSIEERREKVFAYIYAPFRADDLLRGIFVSDPHAAIDFQVYDGAGADAAALMHDSSRFRPNGPGAQAKHRYWALEQIQVAGRPWTIRFVTRPEFERASSRWLAPLIVVAGSLVSLTFFWITRSQVFALLSQRRTMRQLQQSEQELREAKETAEGANQAKDKFIAMLSHELRTPLAPVLATTSLMRNDPSLPAGTREDLGMIERNIQLEARLIDDLLDLTRITRGKLQLQAEVIDAHAILRSAVELCSSEKPNGRNVKIELNLDALRHYVRADPARLQQVFWNLLQNAIKFTPEGGSITARTQDDGQWMRTDISDTGIGIEPGALAKIFQPFQQSPASSRFGGLGLGLSIVKGLVEAHGGRVEANSAGPQRGATLSVWLESAPAPLPHDRPRVDRAITRRRLFVMVVEDHTDTLRAMLRLLKSFGHEASGAASAAEAMKLCNDRPFDLLISDIGLPDRSGYELLPALRACTGAAFKGIALTGFGMPEDVQRAREAGFDAHLTKPVDPATLEATINRLAAN